MSSTTIDLNIQPVTVSLDLGEGDVSLESPGPTVIELGAVVGPQGPQGPPGGVSYVHTQNTALDVWTVQHNLGTTPGGITVLDADGRLILGWTVTYATPNILILSFPSAEPGTAYITA